MAKGGSAILNLNVSPISQRWSAISSANGCRGEKLNNGRRGSTLAHNRHTPDKWCQRSGWPHQQCGDFRASKCATQKFRDRFVTMSVDPEQPRSAGQGVLGTNYGAGEGIRTLDLRFTKPLLYH